MIRQLVPESVCLACRGCCRFGEPDSCWSPALLSEEVEMLVRKNIPPLLITKEKRVRLLPASQEALYLCPFLEGAKNACKIYAFRPFECQLYPFLLNRAGKDVYLALDTQCPYAEEHAHDAALREYARALAGLLMQAPLIGSLRTNLHLIQAYPGVLDLHQLKI
ncbi:MAG: YkgJ family cysteine cluster protein [Candidatus Omnitrophica bacterium]|nr:YkgJ family cysteine cluster protein [Candidatus Omnitrophota bacterium]